MEGFGIKKAPIKGLSEDSKKAVLLAFFLQAEDLLLCGTK